MSPRIQPTNPFSSPPGSPKSRVTSPKPIPKPNRPISEFLEAGMVLFDNPVTFVSHELYYKTEIKPVFDNIIASRKATNLKDIGVKLGHPGFSKINNGRTRFTPKVHLDLYKKFGPELVPEVLPYIDFRAGFNDGKNNRKKRKVEENTCNATGGEKSPNLVFNRLKYGNGDLKYGNGLSWSKLTAKMNGQGISVKNKPYETTINDMRNKMTREKLFTKRDVEQAIKVGLVKEDEINIPDSDIEDDWLTLLTAANWSKKRPRNGVRPVTSTTKRAKLSVPLPNPVQAMYPQSPYTDLPEFPSDMPVVRNAPFPTQVHSNEYSDLFPPYPWFPASPPKEGQPFALNNAAQLNYAPSAPPPVSLQAMYPPPHYPNPQTIPHGVSAVREDVFNTNMGFNLGDPGDPALQTLDSFFNGNPDQYSLQSQLPALSPAPWDVPSIPVGNTLEVLDANRENSWYSALGVPAPGFDVGNPDFVWNPDPLSYQSETMPLSSEDETYPNIPYPFQGIGFTNPGSGDSRPRRTEE